MINCMKAFQSRSKKTQKHRYVYTEIKSVCMFWKGEISVIGGLCCLRLLSTLSTAKLLATHEKKCDLDSGGAGGSQVVKCS